MNAQHATEGNTAPGRFRLPSFGVQVLLGLVAGLVFGLVVRQLGPAADGSINWLAQLLQIIGSTFVRLLTAIVPALVFTAIVASIGNLRQLANAATLVWQTLLWFALTALIAVLTGIALGLIFEPGLHTAIADPTPALPRTTGGWLDFLRGLVPGNMLALEAATRLDGSTAQTTLSFNVLQLLVLSVVAGTAALRVGDGADLFFAFNKSLLAVVRKILGWVIRLTPLGTVGLLGNAVGQYGWSALASLGVFAGAVYTGLALVLFVVYPLLLRLHGLDPLRFFAGIWPAITLAFVSRSSIGTLPVTETLTETKLGVPAAYAAFAVPLGATTKMDGCAAIYPALAAIFVAGFFSVPLHFIDYLLIVLVSVVGSAATAGVTGAVVMLTLTLSTLGLPLEGAGLLLAIDPILDMGRTAVNVAGQALVPTIVAKRQGILHEAVYNQRESARSAIPPEAATVS